MLTFHLIITLGKITLGNEAMQTGEDVADALQKALKKIRPAFWDSRGYPAVDIRDLNGNTVGQWKVTGR